MNFRLVIDPLPTDRCGRYEYHPHEFSDLRIRFNLDNNLPEFKPSYNIAPGQQAPVIIREDGATR
jgi:putative SOS response-associated peptidase YedK